MGDTMKIKTTFILAFLTLAFNTNAIAVKRFGETLCDKPEYSCG